MKQEFQKLLEAETEDEVKEAEKFFLDKTKEALDSDFKSNTLDVAVEFDDFRRRVYQVFGSSISPVSPSTY